MPPPTLPLLLEDQRMPLSFLKVSNLDEFSDPMENREGGSCSAPSLAALSRRAAAPPAGGSAFGLLQFKQHVPPALGAAAAAARPCEGAGRLGSLGARWLASSAPLPGAREIHRINTHFLFLFMGGGRCALIRRSASAALPTLRPSSAIQTCAAAAQISSPPPPAGKALLPLRTGCSAPCACPPSPLSNQWQKG